MSYREDLISSICWIEYQKWKMTRHSTKWGILHLRRVQKTYSARNGAADEFLSSFLEMSSNRRLGKQWRKCLGKKSSLVMWMWQDTWKRCSCHRAVCNKMGTVQSWTWGPFDDREEIPLLGTACGNPKRPQLNINIDLPIPPFFAPKFHVPVEIPGNLLLTSLGTGMKGRNRNRHEGR